MIGWGEDGVTFILKGHGSASPANKYKLMEIKLSFPLGTFTDLADALVFIHPHLNFIPKAVQTSVKPDIDYIDFDYASFLKLIGDNKKNGDCSFQIADDFYSYHDEKNKLLFVTNTFYHLQFFIFSVERYEQEWLNILMIAASNKGMFMGQLYDASEAIWQSEEMPSNFIHAKRRFDMYKTKWHPVLSPIERREIIDIFYNPGHMKMTYGTWLMAAPEMWFGKNSWQYFNKEKILSFNDINAFTAEPTIVQEVDNDLVYVRLFEADFWDYEKQHILQLQRNFRALSKMNEIELLLDSKVEKSELFR